MMRRRKKNNGAGFGEKASGPLVFVRDSKKKGESRVCANWACAQHVCVCACNYGYAAV